MIAFCGADSCSMDSNGRIKLSPRVLEDFKATGSDVVLRCLPEGAIGVYSEEAFLEMRANDSASAAQAGVSAAARRRMRFFNAMSQSAQISTQGRITVPSLFRDHAGLEKNCDVIVAAVEIGIEIWSLERWKAELEKTREHQLELEKREMESELDSY